jgi:branched-chain amino acid transport system permease protein
VAFIALLLGIPMIGLTTVDQGGALRIATRWPALLAFVAACFAGRLLLRYGLDHLRARRQAREQARRRSATAAWRAARC